ncbi:MAG: FG-GAP-like repeat-containing protein [Bacteroidia bacterium]
MQKLFLAFFLLFVDLLHAQYFTKVTNTPITSNVGDSRSVNWIDANNDGFVDCFMSNGPSGGQNNMLFLNDGLGNFTSLTNDPIVMDNTPSDGATWADIDNDGDLDAFVVNWYGVNNLLYLNDGTGHFTQVLTGSLVNDGGYSETAAWGDYDKDGKVDLYVTNSDGTKKNFLYHNEGSATFTKISTGSMVTDAFFSRSVNWTDIDNDGNLDIFVTNEANQHENLYKNEGSGTFTKLNTGALLTNGGKTMSSSWGDYDNDGDLDVFLANNQGVNALFRNEGNFNFTKISNDTVTTTPAQSFSSAWSDIDNDGDLDLFVTNSFGTQLKNFLYLNNGNGSFTRNSSDPVTAGLDWSYGCAFGDYDNDGFEDLAVATCRYNNADVPNLLFHNNGNNNHWITIKLIGTLSNTAAIGTKIRIKSTINGVPTWQMREISAQSSHCGQNDLRAHFGLGDATIIDSIKIEWASGLQESFTQINANQFISIIEEYNSTYIPNAIQEALLIYPNPASDKIILNLKGKPFTTHDVISIIDSQGKKVVEIPASQTETIEINLKQYVLSQGLYFIIVNGKNRFAVEKLQVK